MNRSIFRKWRASAIAGLGFFLGAAAFAAENAPSIDRWLSAQTNLHTWSANLTQTRSLKTLAQPLTAPGRIWFQAPGTFRWELGNPAQTIAIRRDSQMMVIYPRLKRVEKYPLDSSAPGPWRDMMMILDAGFPQTREQLEQHFKLLAANETADVGAYQLQPKSAMARRMIPQLDIEFDLKRTEPRATTLHFADGSTMRNDFTNSVLNTPIEPALFNFEIPSDYTVSEPMKGAKK